MHLKSDNIEIMIVDEGNEVIKELLDSLKNRYQNNLESMKGSEIDWIKTKTRQQTSSIKDNKCFQFSVTVALNHEEIKNDLQRITKIKPFMIKYNWEGINFLSEKISLEKN